MNPSGYVFGIGAANADISGRSRKPILMRDSNPGVMTSSAGGVTRNVCDNLARLGADVRLISAIGDDVYGDMIRRECADAGIDLTHAYTAEGHASSTYMSILDDSGDMLVALSDMSILKELPVSYPEEKVDIIRNAELVTCDPGLPEQTLAAVLDLCEGHVPVYVDSVSTAYARVLVPHIGRCDTVKPNRMELEILSGISTESKAGLYKACETVLAKGLRRVIVSLGKDGCLYMDSAGTCMERKLRPVDHMANATGGGDAFMAAVIYGTLQNFPLEKMLDYALAAGIAAISHKKTINPDMCVSLIEDILKEYRL